MEQCHFVGLLGTWWRMFMTKSCECFAHIDGCFSEIRCGRVRPDCRPGAASSIRWCIWQRCFARRDRECATNRPSTKCHGRPNHVGIRAWGRIRERYCPISRRTVRVAARCSVLKSSCFIQSPTRLFSVATPVPSTRFLTSQLA